jgi:hypothetical protein
MATKFAVELDGQDPEARARVAKNFAALQRRLRDCILAAQRNGDIEPSADADLLARLLVATTRGMDVMARAGQRADELEPIAEAAFRSLPLARTVADPPR